MNNDDKKIILDGDSARGNQKGSQAAISKNNTNQIKTDSSKKNELYDNILLDLAKRSADHKAVNIDIDAEKPLKDNKDISSLQNEIMDLMKGVDPEKANSKKVDQEDLSVESNITASNKKTESSSGSAATSAAINAIRESKDNKVSLDTSSLVENNNITEKKIGNESKELGRDVDVDVDVTIDSIKESISADLSNEQLGIKNETVKGDVIDENTKKLLEQQEKKKGIEQTYYADLSQAMGSNKPETMSELIEKAKYEKKENKIRSPRSKKNIAYIAGAIFLLVGIVGIIGFFFSGKEEVKFITEERVKSLIYSDLDTGINLSGIDSEKTKQAIRGVLETELEEGGLHQIYYAGKDQFGNLRRLGIKQVFAKTDNIPPDLLYQNIENEFMHGVYKTDENQSFMVLKALSYDRSFEGMREWEETIIDDLSTYLDLPKEAGDRSLMEDGFSDDLIKNKNVRVARFLPRDVDRRKGIWNIIDPADTKAEEDEVVSEMQVDQGETTDGDTILGDTISYINSLFGKKYVYAQTIKVCYGVSSICFDFYGREVGCGSSEEEESMTQSIVHNQENDTVYEYTEARNISSDFSCVDAVGGSDAVGDVLDEEKPIICYEINTQCIDNQGNPVDENSPVEKSCHEVIFNEKFDTVYGQEKYGEDGYACINTIEGSSFAGDVVAGEDIVCYLSHKECVDSFGNIAYYSPGDTTIICNDVIYNGPGDMVFGPEFYGEPGYSCFADSGSAPLEYNDALVDSQSSWAWLLDLFFQDSILANGGPIQPGQTLGAVEIIQNELVLLGLMDEVSISGTFDLLTQETISHFQLVNGIPQTGIIDESTINLLNGILSGQGEIFGGSQAAIINDYISVDGNIGLGTYSEDVQSIQMLLFVGGYNISHIDGVFDEEVCAAIQSYQKENGLSVSSDDDCMVDAATLDLLNGLIVDNDYLGSGFILNGNGYLVGSGVLQGMTGPGTIGFEVGIAEAESLNEGDVVLMYTFLDEKTILITRHEEVITEIIKRRAFNDIFNKS